MNDVYEEDKRQLFMPIDTSKVIAVIALGAVIGLLVWGLTLVIDRYILTAVLCQGNQVLDCANTSLYAESVATIVGAIIGLFFLVRLQVFRPLLVVLATVVSLWGIIGLAGLLPWYGIGLSAIILYAFAYGLFAWVARIRSFVLVLVLLVVLVMAVRLTLSL
jgi:hypothetical protein